jgi:Co/Zn/Cd efflux system component
MTFGWHRAEVIGTLMSVAFLIIVTIVLVIEAVKRFITPADVEPNSMLITAVASIFMNLIMIKILHADGMPNSHGHSHAEGEHGHSHSHGGADDNDIDEESKMEE